MTPLNVIDRHHLVPKSRHRRGKPHMPRAWIRIKRHKHVEWHDLFGNRTLDEVIDLLERVRRFKCRRP